MLTLASWLVLLIRGGDARVLTLLALLALFAPYFGPLAIFIFYRPRLKKKRD